MSKAKQKSALDMECSINEFRNQCSAFLVSKSCREECTGRHASLVEVEKLHGDVFVECVNRAMSDGRSGDDIRVVVESEDESLPVVYAKVVDTAKAFIPYVFRRQRWNPFKKHEKGLVLFANENITALDSAMTLSELGKIYEASRFKPFDRKLPWVGVGIAQKPRNDKNREDAAFRIEFGYKVETVGFDVDASRIVVKARDVSFALFFGLQVQ